MEKFSIKLSEDKQKVLDFIIEDVETTTNQDLVTYMHQLLDANVSEEFKKTEVYKNAMDAFTLEYLDLEFYKVVSSSKEQYFIETYEFIVFLDQNPS